MADEAVHDRPGMAHVPLKHAVGGRVVEAVQRRRDPGADAAHGLQDPAGEVRGRGQRLAVQVLDHPHVVGDAVAIDRGNGRSVQGVDDLRGLERHAAGDPCHGVVLELERPAPEVRVRDLQHGAPAGGRGDPVVPVLVAAQFDRFALHPEQLSRQPLPVLRREGRRVDLVVLEQSGGPAHRRRGYRPPHRPGRSNRVCEPCRAMPVPGRREAGTRARVWLGPRARHTGRAVDGNHPFTVRPSVE